MPTKLFGSEIGASPDVVSRQLMGIAEPAFAVVTIGGLARGAKKPSKLEVTLSSVTIVARPWLSLIVALIAFERFTRNVSLVSDTASPHTLIVIIIIVSAGAKLSVPLFDS